MDAARKIIESGKIKNIKDLRTVVEYWYSMGNSEADILNTIGDMEFCWQIKTISPEDIVRVIIQECVLNSYKLSIDSLTVYKSEVESLLKIQDSEVRKLMYCFLVYSKMNNHSSGWIRYDKDIIFKLGGFSINIGNKYISECCKNGLELRVIGTKHPLVCFRIGIKKIDGEQYFTLEKISDVMDKYKEFIGMGA